MRRKRGRRKSNSLSLSQEKHFQQLRALWILRTLVNTPANKEFFRTEEFQDECTMQAMGLKPINRYKITKRAVMDQLKNELSKLESDTTPKKCTLIENIDKLGQRLSLNYCEKEILALTICISTEQVLADILDYLGEVGMEGLRQVLSKILDFKPKEIQSALDKDSALMFSGLIKVENFKIDIPQKLELLEGLSDLLFQNDITPNEILSNFFTESPPPMLTIDQFPHVKADIDILTPFLKTVLEQKIKGVNVLIYGLPGTGKTEFVRSLVKTFDSNLYEINVQDSEGEPLSGQARFSAYQLCQKILSRSSGFILFDEIEDVFPEATFSYLLTDREINKGWTNRILETNPNPAFWLCNSIDQIDSAYKRRFDFVMEMRIPPLAVREEIIRKNLDQLKVGEGWIKRLAENEHITPALLSKSARVAKLTGTNNQLKTEHVLERIINNNLAWMGISDKIKSDCQDSIEFRLEYLNPNIDLKSLIEGIKKSCRGRFCLYGPSGTGKTAFAHYLAKCIEKPVMQKNASDLLDKYIGETETRIADMFRQAEEQKTVLLLDEADSFLRDREMSQQRWEVSQVNELLVQMENFDGVFICSTNLFDDLDKASLRRFDFKIAFDYLTLEQRRGLFQRILKDVNAKISKKDAEKTSRQLAILDKLTPGDFALIKRQSHLMGKDLTAFKLLEGLRLEHKAKSKGSDKVIGFSSANV